MYMTVFFWIESKNKEEIHSKNFSSIFILCRVFEQQNIFTLTKLRRVDPCQAIWATKGEGKGF